MNLLVKLLSSFRFIQNFSNINFINTFTTTAHTVLLRKYNLDYSKVPVIKESDIEEQFVRGSGPGGQAVNKTNNCCVLLHVPTGIRIRCHETRSLEMNRAKAREKLITKLDNMLNSDNSIEAQKKRIDKKRSDNSKYQQKKLNQLKEEWKRREKLLE